MDELDMKIQKLYYNDWKVKDIAKELNVRVNEVKYRIRKMRSKGIQVKRWWKD